MASHLTQKPARILFKMKVKKTSPRKGQQDNKKVVFAHSQFSAV